MKKMLTKIMEKKNQKELKKERGMEPWVAMLIGVVIIVIIGLAAKEPLMTLGAWVTDKISTIVKGFFTGL